MNFEVLKIIILACQVSSGADDPLGAWAYQRVNEYQVECQQDLIQCYEVEVTKGGKPYAVRNCLLRR